MIDISRCLLKAPPAKTCTATNLLRRLQLFTHLGGVSSKGTLLCVCVHVMDGSFFLCLLPLSKNTHSCWSAALTNLLIILDDTLAGISHTGTTRAGIPSSFQSLSGRHVPTHTSCILVACKVDNPNVMGIPCQESGMLWRACIPSWVDRFRIFGAQTSLGGHPWVVPHHHHTFMPHTHTAHCPPVQQRLRTT